MFSKALLCLHSLDVRMDLIEFTAVRPFNLSYFKWQKDIKIICNYPLETKTVHVMEYNLIFHLDLDVSQVQVDLFLIAKQKVRRKPTITAKEAAEGL